jgi:hypothetical protein
VTGVLDMRAGEDTDTHTRTLHFIVGDELVPHAIVNIPYDEKMHMGVCHVVIDLLFLLFIMFYVIYILPIYIYMYISSI